MREVVDAALSAVAFAYKAKWRAEEGKGAVVWRHAAEREVFVELGCDCIRILVGCGEVGRKDDLRGPSMANSYAVRKHVEYCALEVWIALEGRSPGRWAQGR
jgi:hypothetical protein